MLANRRDVPYQSLIKIFLAERVQQEGGHSLEDNSLCRPGSRMILGQTTPAANTTLVYNARARSCSTSS